MFCLNFASFECQDIFLWLSCYYIFCVVSPLNKNTCLNKINLFGLLFVVFLPVLLCYKSQPGLTSAQNDQLDWNNPGRRSAFTRTGRSTIRLKGGSRVCFCQLFGNLFLLCSDSSCGYYSLPAAVDQKHTTRLAQMKRGKYTKIKKFVEEILKDKEIYP